MSEANSSLRTGPRIIIVGAGVAGISAAIQLKRKLRYDNFTIYERADALGGTWRDNTYPGCGSDVPGHWYSLSTDLNPNWSSYYVGQPEIRAYWEALFHRHALAPHARFGHGVVGAEWDADAQRYDVTVERVATGERAQVQAEVMFYAIGGFMSPMFPEDVPGAETFNGLVWHSARWRHDVDLAGKRVAVIGNGCSAAQIVPEISQDPSVQVINICRTPQWYVPQRNYKYPSWVKWVFAYMPFIMRWYRSWLMARADLVSVLFRKGNVRLGALARRLLAGYIKMTAPATEVAKLTPAYPPGCKRIIVDPGYLSSLHRSNVKVEWGTIERVVKEGIRLRNGNVIALDVIIFATGYSTEPVGLYVRGREGTTVQEYFASHGGPQAYYGSCMPGFPNLFTLLGPNVATGHASVIFSQEAQIGHALQLIAPVVRGEARSFEVTEDATERYNGWLRRRLAGSVWTECRSYYQKNGRVVATFPGPVSLFWWSTRSVKWTDFVKVE